MATLGLKGIWGLEQLDKTGIATWKLGLILMGAAGVVGYILMRLTIGMEPNPVFGPTSPQTIAVVTFLWAFSMAGIVTFLLTLARGIEMDLKALALFDNIVESSIERLTPKRALRITCIVLGLLFGCLLSILGSPGLLLNLTVVETFIGNAAGGSNLIFGFILIPIFGLIAGLSWLILISQIVSLVHAARHIKVDLLQFNDYAAIANPGVRLFLGSIPLLSTFPLMMLYLDDPIEIAIAMRSFLFLMFIAVATLLPFAYPIWILRNRIREKKLAEMDLITRSLRGDKEAVKTINIHDLDAPTTAADLLTHQMFLNSLWDWPIASHVQKLILFGLLPPLTWVLAAMIENTMY